MEEMEYKVTYKNGTSEVLTESSFMSQYSLKFTPEFLSIMRGLKIKEELFHMDTMTTIVRVK